MKFNINNNALVQLTDRGRKLHREDHYSFWHAARPGVEAPEYRPPKEDENGWSRWQLWELMQAFGPHISVGSHPPIATEIVIEEDRSQKQELAAAQQKLAALVEAGEEWVKASEAARSSIGTLIDAGDRPEVSRYNRAVYALKQAIDQPKEQGDE